MEESKQVVEELIDTAMTRPPVFPDNLSTSMFVPGVTSEAKSMLKRFYLIL